MNPVSPRIAKGLDLLGFTGDVIGFTILDIAACRRPLKVGVELDTVRWIDVDALNCS